MKKEDLSAALSDISEKYISEAESYDMSNKNIIRRPLSRIAVAAIIIGCLVFGSAAYAGVTLTDWEAVISFFDDKGNETQVTVSDRAFFKELPDGLPVPGDGEPMTSMTKDEVENLLGFKILDSELTGESTVFNYDAYINYNSSSVAVVKLWVPRFITEDETKSINMSVSILSTNAEEGYIYPFIEGNDAMGGKAYQETYTIDALDIDAVMYTHSDNPSRLNATFVYDDIYYHFIAENYTLDEFKAVLDTLK